MLSLAAYFLGMTITLLVARGHLNAGWILLGMAIVASIEIFNRLDSDY